MHRRCCEIMVSLTKIEVESISGKKVNVGTGLPPKLLTRDGRINHEEHEKLAQEDWEIDNGGMGFLDYERFASCWFQVLTQRLSTLRRRLASSIARRIDARWRAESGIAGARTPVRHRREPRHRPRSVHTPDRRPVHRQNSTRGIREVFWGGSWSRSCPRSQRRNLFLA